MRGSSASTRPRIDADPRVIEAEQQHATAAQALHAALEPNPWPSLGVYARIFVEETVRQNPGAYVNARPARLVEYATRTAQHARAEADALCTLTPAEAVERIRHPRASEEAKREAAPDARRARAPTTRLPIRLHRSTPWWAKPGPVSRRSRHYRG